MSDERPAINLEDYDLRAEVDGGDIEDALIESDFDSLRREYGRDVAEQWAKEKREALHEWMREHDRKAITDYLDRRARGRDEIANGTTLGQRMNAVCRELKANGKDIGMDRAIRDYCEPLFTVWMESLDMTHDMTTLDDDFDIVAGMCASVSIRDALITSAITEDLGVYAMLTLASEPHEPASVGSMTRIIADAFQRKGDNFTERIDTAITIMERTIAQMRDRDADDNFISQTLAVVAVLQYMNGASDSALRNARKALELGPDVSLANIVRIVATTDTEPTA